MRLACLDITGVCVFCFFIVMLRTSDLMEISGAELITITPKITDLKG